MKKQENKLFESCRAIMTDSYFRYPETLNSTNVMNFVYGKAVAINNWDEVKDYCRVACEWYNNNAIAELDNVDIDNVVKEITSYSTNPQPKHIIFTRARGIGTMVSITLYTDEDIENGTEYDLYQEDGVFCFVWNLADDTECFTLSELGYIGVDKQTNCRAW